MYGRSEITMSKKEDLSKAAQYSAIISGAIAEKIEDGELSIEELTEDNNMTHFIHAIANMVPTHFYNNLIGDEKNHLEFNHLANMLCFQYSQYQEKSED